MFRLMLILGKANLKLQSMSALRSAVPLKGDNFIDRGHMLNNNVHYFIVNSALLDKYLWASTVLTEKCSLFDVTGIIAEPVK